MPPSFTIPRNWYRLTVTELVENDLPGVLGALTDANAWAYVYAVTLWAEKHNEAPYLHFEESNALATQAGRDFADRGAEYLRQRMALAGPCDPFELVDRIGTAYRAEREQQGFPPPKKVRDPNTTGAAFETVLQVLIDKLCGVTPSRTPLLSTLQGFELAPEGYHSRPDLVLFGPRDFRLLISTKWTLRKERIGTYLHESYFYKNRRPDLQVAFVVNDFQPNILRHLSTDPLVDRVYHVNKTMMLELTDPAPGDDDLPRSIVTGDTKKALGYRQWLALKDRLFDLTDLFSDVRDLRNAPEVVLDPGGGGDDEAGPPS